MQTSVADATIIATVRDGCLEASKTPMALSTTDVITLAVSNIPKQAALKQLPIAQEKAAASKAVGTIDRKTSTMRWLEPMPSAEARVLKFMLDLQALYASRIHRGRAMGDTVVGSPLNAIRLNGIRHMEH